MKILLITFSLLFLCVIGNVFSQTHQSITPPILQLGSWDYNATLASPHGIGADTNGNIYVCDSNNNRICKFGATGTFILEWYGDENGTSPAFNLPLGMHVSKDNFLYVTDCYNSLIRKFTDTGVLVKEWSVSPPRNKDNRIELRMENSIIRIEDGISGIALDEAKKILYIGYNDLTNKTQSVLIYDVDGNFINSWAISGWIAGICVDGDSNVFVVNHALHYVEKHAFGDGTILQQFGSGYGGEDGQMNYPAGVHVDIAGNLYVCDQLNHRLQKFVGKGPDIGTHIYTFSANSTPMGDFRNPIGIISVAGLDKKIYVTEVGNNRVQYFVEIVNVPPPTELVVTRGVDQVVLTWTDNSNDETGFEIQRSLEISPAQFETLVVLGPNITSYTDVLSYGNQGINYIYRIRALGEEGSGPFSEETYSVAKDLEDGGSSSCGATGIEFVLVIFGLVIYQNFGLRKQKYTK